MTEKNPYERAILARLEAKAEDAYLWPRWPAAYEAGQAALEVADQETAELRAEVERLRLILEGGESAEGAMRAVREVVAIAGRAEAAEAALLRVRALADAFAYDGLERHGGNIAWHIEEAIANEKGDFPDAADRRIASQRERAEAAEAESARLASEQRELAAQVAALRSVVAKVEALADEWGDKGRSGRMSGSGIIAITLAACAGDLRDALASVGVSGSADDRREANASQAPDTATLGEVWVDTPDDFEGYDTATPGEATCVCGSPDAYSLNLAEIVVHRTDGPCTVEPAASSTDDKAGE